MTFEEFRKELRRRIPVADARIDGYSTLVRYKPHGREYRYHGNYDTIMNRITVTDWGQKEKVKR